MSPNTPPARDSTGLTPNKLKYSAEAWMDLICSGCPSPLRLTPGPMKSNAATFESTSAVFRFHAKYLGIETVGPRPARKVRVRNTMRPGSL